MVRPTHALAINVMDHFIKLRRIEYLEKYADTFLTRVFILNWIAKNSSSRLAKKEQRSRYVATMRINCKPVTVQRRRTHYRRFIIRHRDLRL